MGDLREEMVNDMGANVMVDTIEYTIITVYCCKPSSQVTPFLIVVTQTKSRVKIVVSNAMEGGGGGWLLPCHDTKEASARIHGGEGKSPHPAMPRKSNGNGNNHFHTYMNYSEIDIYCEFGGRGIPSREHRRAWMSWTDQLQRINRRGKPPLLSNRLLMSLYVSFLGEQTSCCMGWSEIPSFLDFCTTAYPTQFLFTSILLNHDSLLKSSFAFQSISLTK